MKKISWMALLSGVLYSCAITLASFLVMGGYIFVTNSTVYYVPGAVLAVVILSSLIGGWAGGYRARTGGLVNGGAIGLTYALILLVLQARMFPDLFSFEDVIMQSAIFFFLSAVGGIIGVNTPRRGIKVSKRRAYIQG